MTHGKTLPSKAPSVPLRIVLLLVGLCMLALFVSVGAPASDPSFYSSALRPFAEIRVSLGTEQYTVRNGLVFLNGTTVAEKESGDVLRLAYEKMAATRNPLMALAGTDPEKMSAIADTLQETAVLLSKQQQNARDAFLVRSALYPVSFLRSGAALEAARLSFVSSGSDQDARAYEFALGAALDAYRRDLARFRSAFRESVPSDSRPFVAQQNFISYDGVLDALAVLDSGADTVRKQHERRMRCVRGDATQCDSLDIALPALRKPEMVAIPDGALALAREIRDIGFGIDPQFTSKTDPFFMLSRSSCLDLRDGTAPLFSFRNLPSFSNVSSSTAPYLMGDIRFIPSATYKDFPFFGYFAQNNITYVLSQPWTYYACQSSDADLGILTALRGVRMFALRSHPSTYAAGADAPILRRLESKFASSPVMTESDAVNYLETAAHILDNPATPPDVADRLITLVLQMKNRSDGAYQSAFEIALDEQTNVLLNTVFGADIDLDIRYLFYLRSGFAALFLDSNPSATGEHGRLFPSNTLASTEQPFVYYSELRLSPDTRLQAIKDMTSYIRLHVDAVAKGGIR